jgi:hypothetical protein
MSSRRKFKINPDGGVTPIKPDVLTEIWGKLDGATKCEMKRMIEEASAGNFGPLEAFYAALDKEIYHPPWKE